jgi:hypothetical protein
MMYNMVHGMVRQIKLVNMSITFLFVYYEDFIVCFFFSFFFGC